MTDVREIQWDQLFVSRNDLPGDLGGKLQPQRFSTQVFVDVRGWQANYARDNRVRQAGRRIEYTCRLRLPTSRVWCTATRSWRSSCPTLAESFGRTVWCQMPSLDYQVVQQVRPDVVIGVHNERFLLEVPYDSTAPTQAELAASKLMQGKMFGPRTTWETPRVDSFE